MMWWCGRLESLTESRDADFCNAFDQSKITIYVKIYVFFPFLP